MEKHPFGARTHTRPYVEIMSQYQLAEIDSARSPQEVMGDVGHDRLRHGAELP